MTRVKLIFVKFIATIELTYAFYFACMNFSLRDHGKEPMMVPFLSTVSGTMLLLALVRKRGGYILAWLIYKTIWCFTILSLSAIVGIVYLVQGFYFQKLETYRLLHLITEAVITIVLLPLVHSYYTFLKKSHNFRTISALELSSMDEQKMLSNPSYFYHQHD